MHPGWSVMGEEQAAVVPAALVISEVQVGSGTGNLAGPVGASG